MSPMVTTVCANWGWEHVTIRVSVVQSLVPVLLLFICSIWCDTSFWLDFANSFYKMSGSWSVPTNSL